LELGEGGEGAEGVIDLDGGETGGVEMQEGVGGYVRGVEAGLPGGVGPTGGADEEVSRGRREGGGGSGDGFGSARQTGLAVQSCDVTREGTARRVTDCWKD
jgi:hypothetical protein